MGRNRKVIKVGEISGKYDILTVEEKQIYLIGNNMKRRLEMTLKQRDIYARWLKTSKMWTRKRIEK